MAAPPPHHALNLFGVTFLGATEENGIKLGLSLAWILLITVVVRLLRAAAQLAPKRFGFWARQGVSILGALFMLGGLLSIWFNDPSRLATAAGLVTAGVAFALQRVITAVAGYLVILRGSTFNVGDRIVMSGVRGDVVALNFMQTTILEMGASSSEHEKESPPTWVHSRQYTGRIVTVSNAKIFEDPVYNYSKDLKYIWDEVRLPVPYGTDHARVEQILLAAARRNTEDLMDIGVEALKTLQKRYDLPAPSAEPKVYYRLTDNWIELTVRFFVADHGTRERKDRMAREILDEMTKAGLQVASGTYAIVQVPPLDVRLAAEAKPGCKPG